MPAPATSSYVVKLAWCWPKTRHVYSGKHANDQTSAPALCHSVFVGESALKGGEEWTTHIQAAVLNCQVFIALCSKE